MKFIHEDADFEALLQIVASQKQLGLGLIEKDYWVTHTLWTLHTLGLDVWFKGGTSLSKGFNIIQRFSEDLDLKIEPGQVRTLSAITTWKSESKKSIIQRKNYFDQLVQIIRVPGSTVKRGSILDESFRSMNLQVHYPIRHNKHVIKTMTPFVLLEIGNARVTPFVERDLSSFVHDHLEHHGQLSDYKDNRPTNVRCVHPIVTLVEKIDALMRRFPRESIAPATFVRHYEDAAQIIHAEHSLPPCNEADGVCALIEKMFQQKQIAAIPTSSHTAFNPLNTEQWRAIRKAHEAIDPMFWGPRLSVEEACSTIRTWLDDTLHAE